MTDAGHSDLLASSLSSNVLDGRRLAESIQQRTAEKAKALRDAGHPLRLVAVLCGEPPGALVYAERQQERAREVGIDYRLQRMPAGSTFEQIKARIDELNQSRAVTGIMLHLPLPAGIDATKLQGRIHQAKDVEGVAPASIGRVVYGRTLLAPCTARAAVELVQASGVPLKGAEAVVVGASEIVGKPVALLLTQRGATVTICQKFTRDLTSHTSRADILVVAAGVPGLIGADQVKDGACVIDVGINRVAGEDGKTRTVGDVDFAAVQQKAGHITPVPGGVGPMTVAMLLANTVEAAELAARASDGNSL